MEMYASIIFIILSVDCMRLKLFDITDFRTINRYDEKSNEYTTFLVHAKCQIRLFASQRNDILSYMFCASFKYILLLLLLL